MANREIRLRGHHLLCLLGFRGMGYSAAFSANMREVYNELRDEPQTLVSIIGGPDDLCACFPKDAEQHCENRSVYEHDKRILEKLGFAAGMTLPWADVTLRVRDRMQPEDINTLCYTCEWRSYGVCEAGVRTIKKGSPLPPLPPLSHL
ncbi:hypothetical protein A8990_115122 [Paenibacillus taihuensis]|uniref:DUF1284 domain-containing protein n=1 Tax=Paenibacillus taihuensis TaxID=1156355 RepID=A0A3D9RWT7_9BACL|nr:DUF1284 domain-containing protein [Paenibacillus taihuensis]REE84443.1 hypothetical protein A8990_115122 [Paenibacillus taihuensis]